MEVRTALEKKETELKTQVEAARTASDRQMCDFRHQLSKQQDANQEIIDQLERKHAQQSGQSVFNNNNSVSRNLDKMWAFQAIFFLIQFFFHFWVK